MTTPKIYTKTGDKGQTSLVGGQRVSKASDRIKLYGVVDELNSFVGLSRASIDENHKSPSFLYLERIQNLLFNIGSNLACLLEDREKLKLPTVSGLDIAQIETEIDNVQSSLEPLKNFILPGGGRLSSTLHICRTITRRLETNAIDFNGNNGNEIPVEILEYINRLSDYFFVLARVANKEENVSDVIWTK